MASKKQQLAKEYSDAELSTELKDTEAQYHKIRMDHHGQGLDNPMLLREIRRDIARLKTEVRRRELEAMDATQIAKRDRIRLRRRRK